MRRSRFERAISDAGYADAGEFAEAVGCHPGTVRAWLRCSSSPSDQMRRPVAEALDLCWGADCDSVWQSDLDWLLEPCDGTG